MRRTVLLFFVVLTACLLSNVTIAQDYGTQITFNGGNKRFTDWSPDGNWITYMEGGNSWIVSSSGGEPINLTSDIEGSCNFPGFRHDSQVVTHENRTLHTIVSTNISTKEHETIIVEDGFKAFWSNNGQYLVHATDEGSRLVLREMPGGITTTLVNEHYNHGTSCFSPDDSHIITSLQVLPDYDNNKQKLFKIPIEGGEPEQLTFHEGNHWYPDYSPDGKWILFTEVSNWTLYINNTETGESLRVFPELHTTHHSGSFSPDGNKICYLMEVDGSYELFITDYQPPEPVIIDPKYGAQLTYDGGIKWFTNWSPDGSLISYAQRGADGKNDVWIVSSGGGAPFNATPELDGTCYFPHFSFDSSEICFDQRIAGYGNTMLSKVNLTTGVHSVIIDQAVHVAWSHDGRYLAYREAGTADLYILDTLNNDTWLLADASVELALFGSNAYSLSCFSPGDSLIITTMYDGTSLSLFAIPTQGGVPEQLTFHEGNQWYPDISSDGNWILYTNFTDDYLNGEYSIYAYDTRTGESFPVFPEQLFRNSSASFSPDGSQFSYLLEVNSVNSVHEVFIADFPQITVISPNGGENLIAGSEYPIHWESSFVDTLTLEYLSNGVWNTIAENIDASDGIFNWTVPSGNSSDCYIKISDVSNPSVSDQNDEPFTIFELTSELGIQKTFDGGRKWYTDWSKDGQWITYSRRIPQNPSNVYLFSMASNLSHNLTSLIEHDCIFPNFTPDSQEVTYSNHYPIPADYSGWYLESVTIDTNQRRVIVDQGTNGFWSNSGRYFAYSSYESTTLKLLDVIHNTETILAEENYNWAVTTFGPDDSYVITALNEGGYLQNERLYKIPLDGSQSEQLTFHDGSHWYPDCSPCGEWILYTNFTNTVNNAALEPEIWVLNTLTKESTQVFPGCPLENWSANFSPDGSEFCYLLRFDYGYELFITDFPFESQVITAIAQIIEKIETLEDAGEIKKGIANSLIKKLEGAVSKLEQGNTRAAANKLRAFINHLEAIQGKKIDEEDAAEMIAAAEAIISVISSGGGVAKRAVSMEETDDDIEFSESFSLSQNSPNPFNPVTTIEYSIPDGTSEHVSLHVYDLRGALVRKLVDQVSSPGIHSVVWDGTDEKGNRVSSGLYIYRLQAGQFTKSQKMMLLR